MADGSPGCFSADCAKSGIDSTAAENANNRQAGCDMAGSVFGGNLALVYRLQAARRAFDGDSPHNGPTEVGTPTWCQL
jgi:hypothetical protein